MAVNKGTIVMVEPWMDIATTVSASTIFRTGEAAENLGYHISKFYGPQDWNLVFTRLLPMKNPEIVIYGGHGFPEKWLGDDLLFGTLRKNQTYLLKDRVVIAVPSCLTAREMGKQAIKEGAKAYIGSNELVYVAWNEWDHPYRRDFEFTWFSLNFNILNGVPIGKAVEEYKATCNSIIKSYKKRDLSNGDYYIHALEKNRDGMVALGNLDYSLQPPRPFTADSKNLIDEDYISYLDRHDTI